MKLEVGKKYVDGGGFIVDIVSLNTQNNKKQDLYVGCVGGAYAPYVAQYFEDGVKYEGNEDEDIVKEHKEPRTKDVWVVWLAIDDKFAVFDDSKKALKLTDGNTGALKKVTIVEGEFDG